MLSLSEYKKILGEDAQGMTDKEIEELRDAQRNLAEIVFEHWQKNRKNDSNTMAFISLG